MKRIIVTLLAALLVSFALAEAPQVTPTKDFTRFVASELDAVLITCPGDWEEPIPACYTAFGTTDLHRMEIDNFILRFSDVEWVSPWERDRAVVSRSLLLHESGDVFTFFLIELEDFETTVFVQWMLTVE